MAILFFREASHYTIPVKLLPAVFVILLIFLAGLLFLEAKGSYQKSRFFRKLNPEKRKKIISVILPVALLLLAGALFKFLGKIAVLIAFIAGALLFLTLRKA